MEHSVLTSNKSTLDLNKYSLSQESLNVLIIGNNPIELGDIYDKLVAFKGKKYVVDYSFDIEGSIAKIHKFKPKCIVIDDNLSYYFINQLINNIKNDIKTNHISFVLLKNSDYEEIPLPGVQEFLLKEDITSEQLSSSITNSINLKNNLSLDSFDLTNETFPDENKKHNSFYSIKKMLSSFFTHKESKIEA